MNRSGWQKTALRRIRDAKALLVQRRWSAAYYLAGYAVEAGLKACVLVRLSAEPEVTFVDRRFSEKCWTHNLTQLFELAGLARTFEADMAASPPLKDNWLVVEEWTEQTRYEKASKAKAQRLYRAITDKSQGVFSWIRARY